MDKKGGNKYFACRSTFNAKFSKISFTNKEGTLSAVRIDLDLNHYPGEAPLRGTVLVAYNKPTLTPSIATNYKVGGEGITEKILQSAREKVEKENLKIILGESMQSSYITDPSNNTEEEWAPTTPIMFAYKMMQEIGDNMGNPLTNNQREVILSYLVHIQVCNRNNIMQMRDTLGMAPLQK